MSKLAYLLALFLLLSMVMGVNGALEPHWVKGVEKEISALSSTEKFIIAGLEDSLIVLDKEGKLLWSYDADESVTNIIFHENKILVGSLHHLYVFDENGKLKLKKEINGSWIGSMDISQEEIVIGLMNGYLYFYDSEGKEKWNYKLDAYLVKVKILDNGVIGISDKKIYLFDKGGNLIDNYSPSGGNYIYSAFVDENNIGISLGNNIVETYNLGGRTWQQKFEDKIGAIFIKGNYIVLGSRSGSIYLFDSKRGRLTWQKELSNSVKEVQIAKDKVVATTLDNQVYLLQLHSGDLKEKFKLNEKISGLSSSSKDFVIGSEVGNLYYFPLEIKRDSQLSIFVGIVLILAILLLGIMLIRAVR